VASANNYGILISPHEIKAVAKIGERDGLLPIAREAALNPYGRLDHFPKLQVRDAQMVQGIGVLWGELQDVAVLRDGRRYFAAHVLTESLGK
jgi:hypothetical protein